MRWMFTTALSVFCLVASSCSSSSVNADQACSDFSAAYCKRINDCAPFYVQLAYSDAPGCTTRLKLACAPALNAPGTGTTPGIAEACSGALSSASCDDLLGRNLPDACKTKGGSLSNGVACGDNAQCQGTICNRAKNQTCGVCSARVAAGGTCVRDDDCDYGEMCSKTANVCVKFGNVSDNCDADHPCKPTLVCKSGSCATPLGAGAACAGNLLANDCDFGRGLVCNQKVCTQIQLAGGGQPCGLINGGVTLCSSNGFCRIPPATTSGTCVAAAADGAACDTATGPNCLEPAQCVNGACKLSDPASCK